MKKIYFVLLVLISNYISAQDFTWAKRAGSWAYDYGYGVCTDANGNVYVAGKYEKEAVFGNTTVTCQGNHDVFLVKYNAEGDFQWVRTGGGEGGDYARAIACDASGNIYIAGEIAGTVTFGNVTLVANPGTDDAFIAKYNTNGDLLWVQNYGGGSRDDARGIAVDATGNAYVIGVFKGTAYFGSTTLTGSSTEIDDAYILKVDPNGNAVWAKRIGGDGDDTGRGVAVDGSGNVYATGGFIGTADIAGVPLTAPNGKRDMYLAKLSSNGTNLWTIQGGGNSDDVGWAVTTDNTGNVYVTGEFNASATFGPVTLITAGRADVFVTKYNSDGTVQWANRFGSTLVDRARGIATDNSNVYITGQYAGTVTLGAYTRTAADSSDIFVASFSVAGEPGWIVTPTGTADAYEELGYEAGNAIYASGGFVYVTGSYLDGDSFNGTMLDDYSRTDMFVAKIDQNMTPGSGVSLKEILSIKNLKLYPNPAEGKATLTFNAESKGPVEIKIINQLGQVIYIDKFQKGSNGFISEIDLRSNGKGLYYLSISNAEFTRIEKLIIQ